MMSMIIPVKIGELVIPTPMLNRPITAPCPNFLPSSAAITEAEDIEIVPPMPMSKPKPENRWKAYAEEWKRYESYR